MWVELSGCPQIFYGLPCRLPVGHEGKHSYVRGDFPKVSRVAQPKVKVELTRSGARTVQCSECGAEVGERCRGGRSGIRLACHRERHQAYRRTQQK